MEDFIKRPWTIFGIVAIVLDAIIAPLLQTYGDPFYFKELAGWAGGSNAGSLIGALFGCVLSVARVGWLGRIPMLPPWALAAGSLVGGLVGYLGGGLSGLVASVASGFTGSILFGIVHGCFMWGLIELCAISDERGR